MDLWKTFKMEIVVEHLVKGQLTCSRRRRHGLLTNCAFKVNNKMAKGCWKSLDICFAISESVATKTISKGSFE